MDPITITSLIGVGKELIGRIWPDPKDQAEELRKLEELRQKGELAELQAHIQTLQGRMSIIQAEASSEHWLTANWRPIVMLVFTGLIVARWFGVDAQAMSDEEYVAAWELLKLGIGGYVVSRGAEKVAKTFKK